ncbi:MAG: cytochrome c oxidase accessory protein CcoG [Chromatiales bacterium]|nr:cytochrome c oxidase accessory protein CcoG [Chromatiales bacterium]
MPHSLDTHRIYPRSVKGAFRSLKYLVLVLAYGTYFTLPWLRWDRGGGPDQAILFDIHARRFYLFDLVVHPQDIFWLAGMLILAALLLFFVTGLAGRVFCGYFCFQTLWSDVFVAIERFVQGERTARIRLDKAPWRPIKILKKGLTHLLWLVMSFVTGLAFVLYWGDAPTLVEQFFSAEAPFAAYATTLFLTATTYVMAGIAREQVCLYMCPYSRFQSVMFDEDTLVVEYDRLRGEGSAGRGRLQKTLRDRDSRHQAGMGDCIDCGYCVQVCPTGIDIREGLQIECISCGLCIDACNTIMDSVGWERGLIKYTSERSRLGEKTRFIKAKTLGYGAAILVVSGALLWSVLTRGDLDMSASQIRQPLFVLLSDGRIQNRYELKFNNKSEQTLVLDIGLEGLPGAELDLGTLERIELAPEHSLRVMAKVRLAPEPAGAEQTPFTFVVGTQVGGQQEVVRHPSQFVVPANRINR